MSLLLSLVHDPSRTEIGGKITHEPGLLSW